MRWEDMRGRHSRQCARSTVFVQANVQLSLRFSCGHSDRFARGHPVGGAARVI